MRLGTKLLAGSAAVVILATLVVSAARSGSDAVGHPSGSGHAIRQPEPQGSQRLRAGAGEARPTPPEAGARQVTAPADAARSAKAESYKPPPYGRMPPIDPKAHPQAAAVVEALETSTHPERLSPIIAPKPFDLLQWQKDPQAYMAVSEPGRVFQNRAPGKDVPVLRRASDASVDLAQGESVVLAVEATPGAPVSFTSFDGGRFIENTLPALTVVADAQGVAKATYQATSGVTRRVAVLCASPLCSGQIRFSIWVDQPVAGPLSKATRTAGVPHSSTTSPGEAGTTMARPGH